MSISITSSTLSLKPVRIAVVGLRFGDAMARLIHEELPCYSIVMVCDQLEERARNLGEHVGARAVTKVPQAMSTATTTRGQRLSVSRLVRS